ncbi:hypothetical protein [Staphylococcus saprophyticus]|uniref:hypothetical protein n=1 Tax=Staphylococcus saprophyticus TaxID=29385 RepID=UPI0009904960|nr:hypothetical protein [Staphylococcus saprophyticus]OOO72396.1 hypothetical protein B0W56_00475 [Staphylococcus saprophyticus]
MKIKRKVQKTLPQLIEWLLKSGYRNYTANSNMGNIVTLSRYGAIQFSLGTFFPEETFTVEVEEEITEDTKLDLIERFVGAMGYSCYTTHRMTIKDCLRRSPEECTTTHFYIENDNRELVLIWRDGELVE